MFRFLRSQSSIKAYKVLLWSASRNYTKPSSSLSQNFQNAFRIQYKNEPKERIAITYLSQSSSTFKPEPLYELNLNNHAQNHEQVEGIQHQESLIDVGKDAETWLGTEKFSMKNSISHNFGNFKDIITLFTFKVSHVDHPIVDLAKWLEAEAKYKHGNNGAEIVEENPYPLWRAMMVLLATDLFGYTSEMIQAPIEIRRATMERLDRMAKIVEITYLTQQIHKRIIDVPTAPINPNQSKAEFKLLVDNLHKANKAATLIGDLLWTQKCVHMAALKCQPVTELICGFLSDYCESEFIHGVNSARSEHFDSNSWIQKNQLGIGSLLGNSLSATLLFCGHDDENRKVGFMLGSLLGLTYQAYDDIKYFDRKELGEPNWIDKGRLPIVYKIHSQPSLLQRSFQEIFEQVKGDEGTLSRAKDTFYSLRETSLKYLSNPNGSWDQHCKSKIILERFLQSLIV